MEKKYNRRGFLRTLPFFPVALVDEIVGEEEVKLKEDSHTEEKIYIRPPYLIDNPDFSICSECEGNCVTVCEEKIIHRSEDGSPYLIFNSGGCTFCERCGVECPEGILSIEKESKKIDIKVTIDFEKCMAWKKTMCFACKEPCIEDAIVFSGLFNPQIIPDKCTGCGFCLSVCPTNAVKVEIPQGEGNA
ncbi:ferredoxin-type protein NapF [Persephonella sp.]